tara:strand:- start:4 stop:177 length:174 start_codon:yes stop_codon:yes gene_type:complete
MNGNCKSCDVEKDCGYQYKPCDCFNYRKFKPKKPEQQTAQVIQFPANKAAHGIKENT